MDYYSVMPTDWDYEGHSQEVKELSAKGICLPCEVDGVVDHCGSLFPYITTKTNAIKYVKSLKKQFPYIVFALLKGETWGNSELVQEF